MMEWWEALLPIVVALLALMALGVPVAFAFLAVNVVATYILWGGTRGWSQLILSIQLSVSFYGLVAVPLFILMGEVLFRSGIASRLMDVVDGWMGRVPGRLGLVAVASGALFSTLTGSSVATTAVLGKLLVPDMRARGYANPMSIGPILGSGGLATMIPPSALGVLFAAIAEIPAGPFLIAIVAPGALMAALYAAYIVIRCTLQPHLAPSYAPEPVPLRRKLINTVRYVLPIVVVVFLVTGLIFLGIATPTESAALGAAGALAVAYLFGEMNARSLKVALGSTLRTTAMMFMILAGSTAFSQILAFSGASSGLISTVSALQVDPIWIVVAMQVLLLILGTFMEPLSIMLLTIPIYYPITSSLGIDPIWFGAIMLLNMQMASTTPPFGLGLFVMRAVGPPDLKMSDIYKGALPFLGCDLIAMLVIILFPAFVLYLPSLAN